MPNWCNTTYKIMGEATEIADLYKKLKELEEMPEPLVENGFGKLILGCVIKHFGGDWEQIYCRGEIDSLEQCGDNMLQIGTMTAWGDMPKVWDFVLQSYPSMTYVYITEEPGMQYYVNSDTTGEYFPEKYIIDDFANGSEYANDDEDLFEQMAEIMDVGEIKNFEELEIYLELYNADHPDDGVYYHEFKAPAA